ncbi:hypothetical protein ABTG52_19330, partial [Acinetobacter baumannii]
MDLGGDGADGPVRHEEAGAEEVGAEDVDEVDGVVYRGGTIPEHPPADPSQRKRLYVNHFTGAISGCDKLIPTICVNLKANMHAPYLTYTEFSEADRQAAWDKFVSTYQWSERDAVRIRRSYHSICSKRFGSEVHRAKSYWIKKESGKG